MKQLCTTDNYLINIFNFVMDCVVDKGLKVTQLQRFMAWVFFPKASHVSRLPKEFEFIRSGQEELE